MAYLNFFSNSLNRFCVGDRFYLCENKILCEYDYEERLMFASYGNHPVLKRHANSVAQNSAQQTTTIFPKSSNMSGHTIMSMEKPTDDMNNNSNHRTSNQTCGGQFTGQSHLKITHSG